MARQRNAKTAAQAPVSAHPLFPAIVALWFAALLGIGSMLLPQPLFDQVAASTGLGTLGFGFRLGLGALAGLAGAAVGVILARKVAAAHTQHRSRRREPVPQPPRTGARKPISAMEELGGDGLDEPVHDSDQRLGSEPMSGRRRALTVTDESEPADYLMNAPLPGSDDVLDLIGADGIAEEDALELGRFDHQDHGTRPAGTSAPLPASPIGQVEHAGGAEEPFAPPFPADQSVFPAPDETPVAAHWKHGAPFAPPAQAVTVLEPAVPEPAPVKPFGPDSTAASVPATATAPDFGPSLEEAREATAPAPFAGALFSMPVPATEESPALAPAAGEPLSQPGPEPEPLAQPQPAGEWRPAEAGRLHSDLAALDTVSLVERFARALRTAGTATAVEQAPAVAAMPAPSAPIAAGEPASENPYLASAAPAPAPAAPSMQPMPRATAPFAAPSLPAALKPISFDEVEEADDFDHDFALPVADQPRPFAPPATPAVPPSFAMPANRETADSDDESALEGEDGFGSLLAMKAGYNPGREFVRIEEDEQNCGPAEPVVVFPGTAAQGRAAPAPDGPSRDPANAMPRSPFAAPVTRTGSSVDPRATETALREALARLQQMSGAA